MVEAPIADAIAMGVDLENNEGSMVVNIGAQSTNFSIITGGRIIISKKIPIGGRQMNEAVCSEVRKRYNLQIGTRTGKRLKLVMGRLADQHKQARKGSWNRQCIRTSKRRSDFCLCGECRHYELR